MSVIIFEDDAWSNFYPFSSTRHVAQQLLGTGSIIGHLSSRVAGGVSLSGRKYLAATVREETGLAFNEATDGTVTAINARINPLSDLGRILEGRKGLRTPRQRGGGGRGPWE